MIFQAGDRPKRKAPSPRKLTDVRYRPLLEELEERRVPAAVLATGADAGGGPHVILRADTNQDGAADVITASFLAYNPSFTGGVRVALGDFDGDGKDELVTGAGPGGGPHIKIWSLDANGAVTGLLDSFYAFDSHFSGGTWVATGDFDRDGRDELIVSADAGGGPHVRIYSDTNNNGLLSDNMVDEFFAFDVNFRGGVRLAVGNFDANRDRLVVAAGPGGGPHVKIFDNQDLDRRVSDDPLIDQFFPYDMNFRGGVFVTCGNVAGGLQDELIVGPGAGGGPHVQVFNKEYFVGDCPGGIGVCPQLEHILLDSFYAYDATFSGGVRVAVSNFVPADGHADVVTAEGPGGQSVVKIWSGDAGDGRVSALPVDDAFAAYRAANGDFLNIGVFVGFGST